LFGKDIYKFNNESKLENSRRNCGYTKGFQNHIVESVVMCVTRPNLIATCNIVTHYIAHNVYWKEVKGISQWNKHYKLQDLVDAKKMILLSYCGYNWGKRLEYKEMYYKDH
jgi:hypothetical protein